MQLNAALERLDALQRKQIAYDHALSLLELDAATAAPDGATQNRSETLGILSEEAYRLTTGARSIKLIDYLHENAGLLDQKNRRIVEVMRKDIEETRRIPMAEYVAYQRLCNESENAWRAAKEKSDYALFQPYLEKMVESNKRLMEYIRPDAPAYDALLDRFEKGLTHEKCDAFFASLKRGLVPFIYRVTSAPQVDDSPLHGDFPLARQRELSDYLLRVMGVDRAHCAIAETEHPFTTGFTKYDVRVTTHYYPDNFASSMYSVVHEGGHALYDMHPDDAYAYTVLGGGVSMGVHESQSRFYENIIGRSRAFVRLIAPKLRELFPSLKAYDDEALYKAVNRAAPSLIRTEADELTYCLHIMIRYDLERQLFDGSLSARELPEAWNALYQAYLGVAVPNDREGVLQDTHWSNGLFGYFPSYALGSAYGAQMLAKMRETVDVDACVAAGDLAPVNGWLCQNIWRHGGLYEPEELLTRAFGQPFEPAYYIDYLKQKYADIYGIAP